MAATEYDVNQIEVDIFGESPFIGITGMEYDVEAEVEGVTVVGKRGIQSFRDKGMKFSGKISILHSHFVEKVQSKLPPGQGAWALAEFDASIVYVGPNLKITTDKWLGVRITKYSKKFSSGDGVDVMELECAIKEVQEGL